MTIGFRIKVILTLQDFVKSIALLKEISIQKVPIDENFSIEH